MDSIIKKVKLPDSSTEYGINDVRISTSAISSPTHVLGYNSSNTDSIGSVAISELASGSDTKNTAGATDTSAQLFLIGATTQGTNPQTYSQDTAYVGTDGCLYSGGNKVITDVSSKADLVSPAFTGTPTAPTAAAGTNTTLIATTAFVAAAIPTVPTNVSAFTNDSGYITSVPINLSNGITTDTSSSWYNGFGRLATNAPFTVIDSGNADCMLIHTSYSDIWGGQIALDYRSNNIAYRCKTNGTVSSTWAIMLTNENYRLFISVNATVSAITSNTSSTCSITGSSNSGKMETIIYTNNSGSNKVVTVPTTYTTPDGAAIELTIPNGGYAEVNYININGTIYARGL